MGETRNKCNILVGDSEGKRLLGRPMHRWYDKIKIGLKEMRCEN
jgi:hypothetical protein